MVLCFNGKYLTANRRLNSHGVIYGENLIVLQGVY